MVFRVGNLVRSWVGFGGKMSNNPVEVVTLIKTSLTRAGKGVESDPVRVVTEYWDLEGNLVFEIDPHVK